MDLTGEPRNTLATVLTALLSVCGVAAVLLITVHGAGISPDSTIYLSAASNLAGRRGLLSLAAGGLAIGPGSDQEMPLTHFPPLYPALLGLTAFFGTAPESGARWLNAALFGANIFLTGSAIRLQCGSALVCSLFGSFLVASAVVMLQIHSMAWSEPLFIFFSLLSIMALTAYLRRMQTSSLILSSVAAAAAALTRYAGFSLSMASIACIVARGGSRLSHRLKHAAVYAGLSLLPSLVWMTHNLHHGGNAINRDIALHPIPLERVQSAILDLSSWLSPFVGNLRLNLIGQLIMVLIIAAIVMGNLLEQRGLGRGNLHTENDICTAGLCRLLATYVVVYLAVLAVSRWLLDAQIMIDQRILAPIYPPMVMLFLMSGWRWLHSGGIGVVQHRAALALIVALSLIYSRYQLSQTKWWINQVKSDGQGYAARRFTDSDVLRAAKSMPAMLRIYTNDPYAIYYFTGRPVRLPPLRRNPYTLRSNPGFADEMEAAAGELQGGAAAVVWFEAAGSGDLQMPTQAELTGGSQLRVACAGSDGAIYAAPGVIDCDLLPASRP